MAQGIVAKIWNIKAGSQGRSSSAQIGDSIAYITNSEKCDAKILDNGPDQLQRELLYVANDVKTLEGLYVGCRNITDVSNAVNEMLQVKEFYGKTDGRIALHGIVSLDEAESDPKNAGKLMLLLNDLMQEVFPDNQVVYAVHTNTENLHIHFIANTVGLDGKKIHMDKDFMRKVFEPAVNRLAVKYGFTPNEAWSKETKRDEVPFVQRKIELRSMVDEAIERSDDFKSFVAYLRDAGVCVNIGKNLALQLPDMSRCMRSYQLGTEYSLDAIKRRIETKRDAFEHKTLASVVKEITAIDMMQYEPMQMKKYKDMTKEEKQKAIHLLKLGRNPWKEGYERNWQLQKISKELTEIAHITDIIQFYSDGSGNTKDAKEEITARQKLIAAGKKEVKDNLRRYKPIIDLYEEMKKFEVKSYLYEFADCKEYKDDFEKYKELSNRLMDGYGKNVSEVAEFVEDQNNQLLYAQAQSKELSSQYRAIVKYEKTELAIRNGEQPSVSFFDAVGHSKAREQANMYGILTTRLAYITSEENSDIQVRVMTTPDVVNGKPTVTTTITVMDAFSNTLDTFSSDEMSAKEFNKKISEIRRQYNLNYCKVSENENQTTRERGEQKQKFSR